MSFGERERGQESADAHRDTGPSHLPKAAPPRPRPRVKSLWLNKTQWFSLVAGLALGFLLVIYMTAERRPDGSLHLQTDPWDARLIMYLFLTFLYGSLLSLVLMGILTVLGLAWRELYAWVNPGVRRMRRGAEQFDDEAAFPVGGWEAERDAGRGEITDPARREPKPAGAESGISTPTERPADERGRDAAGNSDPPGSSRPPIP